MTKKSTSFLVLLLMSFFFLGAAATPTPNESSGNESSSTTNNSTSEGVSNLEEVSTKNPLSPGTVTSSDEINGEIPTDASFQIVLKESMTQEDLSAILSVQPSIDDMVLEGSETEWTLSHEAPLKEGTVYSFSFIDPTTKNRLDSYAFQTTQKLVVRQVYPSNDSSSVETNTGISMDFSLLGVEIEEDQFEITPAVSGEFLTNNYRVTFVPNESLEENTLYSVTLNEGITSASGQVLATDYSWKFSTSDSSQSSDSFYMLGNFSESFIPEDPIVVEFSGNWADEFQNISASINVHQLSNPEDYLSIMQDEGTGETRYSRSGSDELYDTSKLTEIASFDAEGNRIDDYRLDILFPDNLENGWYIATVNLKNDDESIGTVQKLLQISPIVSYILSSQEETLVWLNNSETNSVASGLNIVVTDSESSGEQATSSDAQEGTTDEQGLFTFSHTSTAQSGYITVSEDDTPVFYESFTYSSLYGNSETDKSGQFYSAIYTDRTLYNPTDTIHFWGYLRSKNTTNTLPSSLYAGIGRSSEVFDSTEIQLNSDGSFTGQIAIENLSSASSYSLYILDAEGNSYLSQSISVADFVKPTYLIDASFDKDLYYANEEVTAEISVEYYDETPVIDSSFSASIAGSESKEIVTDKTGQVTFTGEAWEQTDDSYPSWTPTRESLYVSSTSPSGSQTNASFSYTVLPSKYAAKLSGNADSLTIETSTIDETALSTTSAFNEYSYPLSFYEKYAEDSVDIPFTLVITKTTFTKEEKNSYYDSISQQTVAEYSYTPEETKKTVDGTTEDGKATLTDLGFDEDEEGYYSFELQFDGGVGQTVSQSLFNYPSYPESTTYNDYSLLPVDESSEYPALLPISFTLDEDTELSLYNKNEWVENEGNVLSVVYQENFLNTAIYSGDSYTLKLDQSLIPNFSIGGAYFGGRHIYNAPVKNSFVYDYSQQELEISIDTGEGPYAPGEEIEATVIIKDQDGNPVSGVGALGVVDESLFSLSPQSVDLLSQLYKTTYYPSTTSTSYSEYTSGITDATLMAEQTAAGGDDGVNNSSRSDFLDTAAFTSLTFNAEGEATATVTLPDNITSWRFTAVAVTNDLEAGSVTENVIATKDFYLLPLVTDTYLVGDDISFSAIASGSSLSTPADVLYSFSVQDENGEFVVSKTASGLSSEYTNVNLGQLPAGSYTLGVEAIYGENKDTLTTPCIVAENTLYPYTLEEVSLEEISSIKSVRYPVDVIVYNPSAATSVQTLASLYWSGSDRTESKVAAYKAQQKINELVENTSQTLSTSFMSPLISNVGGVKSLLSSGSDVGTTAKIAAVAPELLDTSTTISYFQTVLEDENTTSEERSMALLGMAALDQPVLVDLRTALAEENMYTEVDRLYFGAGLALLGDFDGANAVYSLYAQEQLTSSEVGSYLKNDGNDATAAALLLTSITGQEDASKFALYLNDLPASSSTQLYPYDLERLAYALFYGDIAGSGSLTVDVNGESTEIDFAKTPIYGVSLIESTLSTSTFTSSTEDVKALVGYQSTEKPTVDEDVNTDDYSIQKTYTPVSGEDGQIGSLTKVTVEVTVPTPTESMEYTIYDAIPSGYRYAYSADSNANAYFTEVQNEKQQIEATLYCQISNDTTNSNFPISEIPETEEEVAENSSSGTNSSSSLNDEDASSSRSSSSTASSRNNSSSNSENSVEETDSSSTASKNSSSSQSSSQNSSKTVTSNESSSSNSQVKQVSLSSSTNSSRTSSSAENSSNKSSSSSSESSSLNSKNSTSSGERSSNISSSEAFSSRGTSSSDTSSTSSQRTSSSETTSSTSDEHTSSSDSSTASSSSETSSSSDSSSPTTTYTIVYYISGTLPGEYISQSPILINPMGKIVAVGEKEENVLINPVISE